MRIRPSAKLLQHTPSARWQRQPPRLQARRPDDAFEQLRPRELRGRFVLVCAEDTRQGKRFPVAPRRAPPARPTPAMSAPRPTIRPAHHTIRPAHHTEASRLSALALRAKAHWGYSPAFMQACRAELTVSSEQIAQGIFVVAEIAQDVVGCYALLAAAPDEWELDGRARVDPHRHRPAVARPCAYRGGDCRGDLPRHPGRSERGAVLRRRRRATQRHAPLRQHREPPAARVQTRAVTLSRP